MYIELTWVTTDPGTGEITYDSGDYQIENLSFSPQVDLTGNSLPVNEYSCDVILPEPLPGELASAILYDGMDQYWSQYPLYKVVKVSDKCLRITARSWIQRLEYRQLEAVVYTGQTAETATAACFGADHGNDYSIQPAVKGVQLYGYAPEQNARERLKWILFAIGAYVNDVYRSKALIAKVDESDTLIPYEHTFRRPTVDSADWVTGLKFTVYTFRQAASEAEWQADDSSYMFPLPWIASTQTFELSNPLAPLNAPENVIEFDNLYLIHSGNVSDIASRLSNYWFNPTEAQLDCINNHAYRPGDLVTASIDEETLVTGYVQQAAYKFGLQARSTLRLIGVETRPSATLTVNYMHGSKRIGRMRYRLPIGLEFSIENPYLDQTGGGHRYVYRPTTESATGTMVEGGVTVNVIYEIALDLYEGVLHVISVDGVTQQEISGEQVAVID